MIDPLTLPRWRWARELRAVEIASIDEATLTPVEPAVAPFDVAPQFLQRQRDLALPAYYTVDADGFERMVAKDVFEAGYEPVA